MAFPAHATSPRFVSLLLFLTLCGFQSVRADDLTGMAQDDPKDFLPSSAQPTSSPASYNVGFLSLPPWARGTVLSPLPEVLKPMGKKPVLTTPPVPAPPPLAPPKESEPPTVVVAKPTLVAPASAPAPTPALIAVSPFLDWIKANPQAAADQARQRAGAYQAATEANTAEATTTATVHATGTAPAAATPAPYWMPPLVDSAPFGTGNTTDSSAAIYSTPQR